MSDLPKVGDRIRLIEMPHDPDPIPPGSTGTVTRVDEYDSPMPMSRSEWTDKRPVRTQLPAPDATAQIAVDWDDDRSLMLTVPTDTFVILEDVEYERGDAVVIHYPDHDVPAVINRVGTGELEGSYHLVSDHSLVWLEPNGPVITFERTKNTEAHNKVRPICDLPKEDA